ncbi:hypothetical protein D3C86_1313660 [compost metagenome]
MAIFRIHRQARQLTGIRIGNLIQRRAGDDHAFALDHAELLDFSLQHFAGTPHQNALLFQRADQIQQSTNVFDGRFAHHFELLLRYQRTATVAGEQFGQQCAVLGIADDMAARHAATAGFGGGIQQFCLIVAAQTLQMRRHLLRAQLTHQPSVFVDQAQVGAEQQQLVRAQVDGRAGGDVFAGEVEDFTGRRVTQWR